MNSLKAFSIVTLGAAAIATVLTSWDAQAKVARVGEPSVSFSATGPAGMKIVGITSELSVSDDGNAIVVDVPLGNLHTGITLRDQHMREKYLQVSKFPKAELTVTRGSLKFPSAGAQLSADASGTMLIHGQTKPVTIHYTARRDGSKYQVNGTVHVNMKEFGIDVPNYLGVTVNPDVEIAVKFDANDA